MATKTTTHKYVPCQREDIPAGIRFDTQRHAQGQIVEVSYGTAGRSEAGPGDPFKRVWDHSSNSIAFYRLA